MKEKVMDVGILLAVAIAFTAYFTALQLALYGPRFH